MNRWKPALDAFAIIFEGRLFCGSTIPNNNDQPDQSQQHS